MATLVHGNAQTVERERLGSNTYFTAMVLAVYDNILGPTMLKVWSGKSSDCQEESAPFIEPTIADLSILTSFTIKDEAGREEKIFGVETKFYALKKMDLMCNCFIFRAPLRGGKLSVFAFYLTLPYVEISEFMPRFSLCEEKVHHLLRKQLISKLDEKKVERPNRMTVKEQIHEFMPEFTHKLMGLCQMMLSIRQHSLPQTIKVADTLLGSDLNDQTPVGKSILEFLTNAICCHLQLGGHSVVFGSKEEDVNKVLNTLALFIDEKDRKISRTVPTIHKRYVPNLFLQGYLKKQDGSYPFTIDYLWKNRFPSTVIDVDKHKVFTLQNSVPVYMRRKEEDSNPKDDLTLFEHGKECQLIRDYMRQLLMLPGVGGVREAFTYQYVRMMKLKAVSVCKYIEAEQNASVQEQSPALWPAINPRIQEGAPKVNKDMMLKDLAIGESHLDLLVVLCYAERMRLGTYKDVLGDPQKDIEHILIDLEFV